MATLRTTHVKHELAAEPNITMLPDGTTVIPGLVTDSDDPEVVTTLDDRIDTRVAAATLRTLSDVSADAPNDGDSLTYNSTSGKWEPGPSAAVLSVDTRLSAAETEIDNLQSAASGAAYVPSGAVFWFAADSAPSGYLECDGSAVSRSTYSALFGVVSTVFGEGDGATTFNLPDLRGEFVRGWDDGRGADSGRAFGSAQTDELESHTHNVVASRSSTNSDTYGWYIADGTRPRTIVSQATGGAETRPRNVALLACIKT